MSSRSTSHEHGVTAASSDECWGPFDRCFSVNQAAEVLGTSSATVRRLLHANLIAYQKVSARRTVIRESALRAYMESVTRGAVHD